MLVRRSLNALRQRAEVTHDAPPLLFNLTLAIAEIDDVAPYGGLLAGQLHRRGGLFNVSKDLHGSARPAPHNSFRYPTRRALRRGQSTHVDCAVLVQAVRVPTSTLQAAPE